MRSAGLFALVVVAWGLTALSSPWLAWGLASAFGWHFTFARLWVRVFELVLVAAVAFAWRALDLGTVDELGLRRATWRRDLVRGVAIGLAGVGAGLVLCWLGGAFVPALRFPPGKTVRKVALGLAAAVAIGAGEETLFRGVVLRRLSRDWGTAAGVFVTSAIYAAVHAIRTSGGSRVVTVWAGFERGAALLAPLVAPATLPGLAGLFGLGLVLALARIRSGSLWLPIGIHATWVAVFRVGRLFFDLRQTPTWLVGPGWPPLVGGAAGWVAVGLTGALSAGLGRRGRPAAP